jgi:hypothetical protein
LSTTLPEITHLWVEAKREIINKVCINDITMDVPPKKYNYFCSNPIKYKKLEKLNRVKIRDCISFDNFVISQANFNTLSVYHKIFHLSSFQKNIRGNNKKMKLPSVFL